jgi:hypothetical protein
MSFMLNLSENDFNRTLEEIDNQLASSDAKIQGRELRGWMLFCARFNLEGIRMDDPLSQKVMEWFTTRYGERLNLDLDFGQSVLLLRADLVRFRCAWFAGRVCVICSPPLMQRPFEQISVNRSVISNALSLMSGLTPAYAQSLNKRECDQILSTVVKSKIRLARIADTGNQTYVPEAQGDLRTAVEQMMLADPRFGLSKWSSLQAVEKFLKAYIAQHGAKFKRVHYLADLADHAESLGLKQVNRATLDLVQCPADVRYDSSSVTRSQAVKAYDAALSVSCRIAEQLSGRSEWNTGVLGWTSLRVEGAAEAIPAILIARTKQRPAFNRQIEEAL